ncbi:hypothetical protein B0H34DRAFT_796187 [Crassisporium funariophilum]|nr:hypothetical protein B0H34DRAFT_796187 [Crassisporium funariophilum]
MPSLYLNEAATYDFDWSDDEDLPTLEITEKGAHIPAAQAQRQHGPRANRFMAGNKRVAQYRIKQGFNGSGHVLQSVTAAPGLKHSSFEEMRVECYLQSSVAQGKPPAPVDPIKTPWAVFPPMFNASRVENLDEEEEEEDMDSDIGKAVERSSSVESGSSSGN